MAAHMFWMIGAILIFVPAMFFSCLVNAYAFTAFTFPNKAQNSTKYGIAFVLAVLTTLCILFRAELLSNETGILLYGGITAISIGALRTKTLFAKSQGQNEIRFNPLQIIFTFLVIGLIGIALAYLFSKLLVFMFSKGLNF